MAPHPSFRTYAWWSFLTAAFWFWTCEGSGATDEDALNVQVGRAPSLVITTGNVIKAGSWVSLSYHGVDPELLEKGSGDYICTQDAHCKTVSELNLWVGVFLKDSNISQIGPQDWGVAQPPWLATAPIKWKPINSTSGQVDFYMDTVRAPLEFLLFANGTTYPTLLTKSQTLVFSDFDLPRYPHLSRTQNQAEMRVTWQSTYEDDDAEIRFGYGPDVLTETNRNLVMSTYSRGDLCGPPATTHGWINPGYFYSGVMRHLKPGSSVYYSVGSRSHGFTSVRSFRVPTVASADAHIRMVAIADMGETYIDGAQYHWMEPYAINTSHFMALVSAPDRGNVVSQIKKDIVDSDSPTELLVHVGDISYATGYLSEWDRFFAQITPIASRVAYMSGIGNHERDFPGSGSFFQGRDSGGECGVAAEARFHMPYAEADPIHGSWYSFEQGPVHFLMMDTEMESSPGSKQYEFFQKDLSGVNRSITPWVVFMGHRPMYTGNTIDVHLQEFESLLVDMGVDLCLWGHVHNAQVTCAVVNGTCVKKGPIHAVIGNAGQSLTPFPAERASWSRYQASEFGFSTIEVKGREWLRMNYYGDLDNRLHYTFNITK